MNFSVHIVDTIWDCFNYPSPPIPSPFSKRIHKEASVRSSNLLLVLAPGGGFECWSPLGFLEIMFTSKHNFGLFYEALLVWFLIATSDRVIRIVTQYFVLRPQNFAILYCVLCISYFVPCNLVFCIQNEIHHTQSWGKGRNTKYVTCNFRARLCRTTSLMRNFGSWYQIRDTKHKIKGEILGCNSEMIPIKLHTNHFLISEWNKM